MSSLKNRNALVTGGSSGIGLATVKMLGAEGARAAIIDVQPPPRDTGDLYIAADVGDKEAWTEVIQQVEREFGGIDIGYLNAGIASHPGQGGIEELSEDAYRRMAHVNMDGVFFGAQALIAPLARRGGGSIVATASLAGLIPFSADIVYTMTKHAVVGMVRSLAMALETRRITVNAVCPGFVDTPIIGEARDMFISAGFPLLQPEDIAAAVRTIIETGRTGECWVCQPGRDPEPYRFHGVPGPRVEGKEGMIPPQLFGGEPE